MQLLWEALAVELSSLDKLVDDYALVSAPLSAWILQSSIFQTKSVSVQEGRIECRPKTRSLSGRQTPPKC
jgi:hypothetical protein